MRPPAKMKAAACVLLVAVCEGFYSVRGKDSVLFCVLMVHVRRGFGYARLWSSCSVHGRLATSNIVCFDACWAGKKYALAFIMTVFHATLSIMSVRSVFCLCCYGQVSWLQQRSVGVSRISSHSRVALSRSGSGLRRTRKGEAQMASLEDTEVEDRVKAAMEAEAAADVEANANRLGTGANININMNTINNY